MKHPNIIPYFWHSHSKRNASIVHFPSSMRCSEIQTYHRLTNQNCSSHSTIAQMFIACRSQRGRGRIITVLHHHCRPSANCKYHDGTAELVNLERPIHTVPITQPLPHPTRSPLYEREGFRECNPGKIFENTDTCRWVLVPFDAVFNFHCGQSSGKTSYTP